MLTNQRRPQQQQQQRLWRYLLATLASSALLFASVIFTQQSQAPDPQAVVGHRRMHLHQLRLQIPMKESHLLKLNRMDNKEEATEHGNHGNWRYQPWDCSEVQQQVRDSSTTWTDPNNFGMHARYIHSIPNAAHFYMSLSVQDYDPMRWEIMTNGFYYEKALTQVFVDILRDPAIKQLQDQGKDVRVVDVGSNQGWFSLVSATMGYPVDAFDANPIHLLRICESNELNHWTGLADNKKKSIVNVYNYGVSDKGNITIPFMIPKNNPGAATFRNSEIDRRDNDKYTYSNMTLLTLDDFSKERGWLSSSPDDSVESNTIIAILKVDVESLEDKVFLGARKLIKSGRVRNVLMEVTASGKASIARGRSVVKYLSSKLELRAYGYWMGPNQDGKNSAGQEAMDIIEKSCFEASKTCNLWWTARVLK